MRRVTRVFLLTLSLLMLSGCYTLHGYDNSAPSPFVRTSFPLGEKDGSLRMQIAAAHQEGKFQSELPAYVTAQIGDASFKGPTTLSANASFTNTRIDVVFPIRMKRGTLRGEATAGGAMLNKKIRASNGLAAGTQDERHYAPNGGFAIMSDLPEQRVGLRGAADLTLAWPVTLGEYELLATYAPTQNIELLLGYRAMNYLDDDPSHSMHIVLVGPAAGIHFRF